MTQRWRRKAQDVQAILRRKGEEVWWRVRGLVSKEGHAYYLPNEWRDVSIEQFERDYEPVPEHNEYGPDCVRTNGRLNDALETLQLADKLAEASEKLRDQLQLLLARNAPHPGWLPGVGEVRMATITEAEYHAAGRILFESTKKLSEYLGSRGKGR